jgi:beta-phosphoglucomutase-like phosphatase (HAD superfamily)
MTARRFRAAIFDIDGVVVDSPHEQAWRESLRDLMEHDWRALRSRTTWTADAFTSSVYQQYVAGKPRLDGAAAVLLYFGIDDTKRVAEYAARKQEMIVRLIDAGEFTVFPDALRFVAGAKNAGLLLAAASSSKNASTLLRKIPVPGGMTLLDQFDVDVSGRDFTHGKPDPEMFLTAAHELHTDPVDAVVLEDAVAGIVAAKRAAMGSIGIARADDTQLLADAEADVVVRSLDEIDPQELTYR